MASVVDSSVVPHVGRSSDVGLNAPTRLAAVVVTFNRLDQVKRTIARLLDEPCDRLIVIDNGSTDGTKEWLRTIDNPRVRVIMAPGNLGGAGGFELGLRKAMELDDPDWVVIMDDDARPEPGCFSTFLEQDMSEWDAVSAAVYQKDGEICEMNRPTINPFWHMPTFFRTALKSLVGRSRGGFHIPDEAYESSPQEIDATSFVGLFLPRETIAKAGYPDGSLFIYGDDVLYTLGLRKAGMRIGFVPDLRFEHDFNRAYNGDACLYNPIWKAYYTARNGLLVYRLAAGMLFWPAFLVILLKWLSAGRHYGEVRRTYYRMVWHGVKDGLVGKRSRPHSEVTSLASADA
ncbi:glycosyltransferase [Tropicimonas marinistellae]|uniref:glycosyltransferase n=1 Tax=Tropicimonas marinistellae TaxID=1739787 RepID=UPI00098F6124|nr:glycosyltransferase [Tropicimonas marinistellae]